MSDDAIERIYRALVSRELADEDLSARRIAAFLGKTTGVVYHHFGSVDRLLFEVSQLGYAALRARLEAVFARSRGLADVAEAFVEFGLEHPELYPLMFERRYDWAALRAAGVFERPTPSGELLAAMVCLLEEAGAKDPLADGRLLFAGLHGLVSLAASGRVNAGSLDTSDREVAVAAARDLAGRIATKTKKGRSR